MAQDNAKTMRLKRSSMRFANLRDLQAIHAWLVDEDRRDIEGNFLCNWSVIENAQRDRELLVFIDGASGLPIAFHLGGLVHPGILQVRKEYRRRGIGRKMVDRCASLAYKRDQCLLYIECTPSSSIPFWERMGFRLIEGSLNGKNFAYRFLKKEFLSRFEGYEVDAVVRFYPDRRNREESTDPYEAATPEARRTRDGVVHFSERVFFHSQLFPDAGDVVVEIQLGGKQVFIDKAKYEEAKRMVVTRCSNGFYIDRLHT